MVELYSHQKDALEITKDHNKVAYYHDMGLGKTFTGSGKMIELGASTNLVICQKSKIDDWLDHFQNVHGFTEVYDLTNKKEFDCFFRSMGKYHVIGVINYELVFRRSEIKKLKNFTLMLDESSLIQNPTAKRTKFIMSLKPDNVILLSGTPTGGKYERLVTQMNLIGWNISENTFWNQYVEWHWNEVFEGKRIKAVDGYKNEERLKRKMRQHGCHFLKTEEVVDLPDQTNQYIKVDPTKEYQQFRKHGYVIADGEELIGDTVLTKILYERQLCGQYNKDKFKAFVDLALSTEDRLIVFYNFTAELDELLRINLEYLDRPVSIVSGPIKDLSAYESESDSITFIQYQAGAMGLNLQKANKIIYFTPPLSSELFEQSKKRIHRINQTRLCFYYYLVCKNSVEEKIYATLALRRDYTEALFEGGN